MGYTDPDLTASAFDDEGWYHTGDIGELDDDGYLTITDRLSDIIIRGGENISAREVEELARRSRRGGRGQRGRRARQPLRRARRRRRAGPRRAAARRASTTVRAHLAAEGLARQKWPESLHLVDDLPRTPSGKVQKFVLRRRLREGSLDAPATGVTGVMRSGNDVLPR